MTLRGEAHAAQHPWLDTTPVSGDNERLLNIGHTFMGLLGVVEVAVELLPGLSAGVLFELDSARTTLSSVLSAKPVLVGPLLRALDDSVDAVDGLLDWLSTTWGSGATALVQQLVDEHRLKGVVALCGPTVTVAQVCLPVAEGQLEVSERETQA